MRQTLQQKSVPQHMMLQLTRQQLEARQPHRLRCVLRGIDAGSQAWQPCRQQQ